MPESRFELQHAESPSEEAALEEEDEKRPRRRPVGASGISHQETAGGASSELRARKQIEAARSTALPAGALEYPELELSNNLAENSMRPVAIGRKNWIHIGSPQAGPKIAAILSIVESCRRLRFPVRDYLAAILPGLADLPIQRIPELTPAAWIAQHPLLIS